MREMSAVVTAFRPSVPRGVRTRVVQSRFHIIYGGMTEWSKVCDSSESLPDYSGSILICVSRRGFKSHFRQCFCAPPENLNKNVILVSSPKIPCVNLNQKAVGSGCDRLSHPDLRYSKSRSDAREAGNSVTGKSQ